MKHLHRFAPLRRWAAAGLSALLALALAACGGSGQQAVSQAASAVSSQAAGTVSSAPPAAEEPQQQAEQQEYRAVWVSYLEWGSFDFSSAEAFSAQADALMDNCAALGLNTVIAQVRPFADALYPSALFPWSSLCTGTQGQDPGFDPLAILVQSAHSRGLRLEAWINPYRVALSATQPASLAENGLAALHPEWVKTVGEGLYLDPANAEVQDYICQGVAEIVRGYEVDGVQFDDYFYPTTDTSFDQAEYAAQGGGLELGDWRRQNVNDLVSQVYQTIKSIRPACQFGISPQGNNDNNYNGQYSDVALWMAQPGYLDYVMPQVYWGYGYTTAAGRTDYAFENVTAAWAAMERDPSVSLYFGLGAYRIGDGDGGNYDNNTAQWQTGHALADMVQTLRQLDADGFALYRYGSLFANSAWPELALAEQQALIDLLG